MAFETSARDWARLGAVFVALVVVAATWTALDRQPPIWDHANHLERAILCARDLRAGDAGAIFDRSSFYPPLALCLAGAASMAMPIEAAALAVMLAFLGLGMAAVYALGGALAGRAVGTVAAVLFATAPFVVYSALRMQLDLPLAAMVAVALVVLLATEGFTRPGAVLLCGVVWGLGMLTKPTFALYIVPPAAWVLLRARRRGVIGAGLALVVGAAISLPWYGPRLFGLAAQFDARAFAQAAEAGHPDPLTLTGLVFYPRWFGYQIGLAAAVLTVVGLAVALARRHGFLLVAVLGPFVVVELARNKNLRYTLPLLGAAAVLAALGLDALPRRIRRLIAAALAVLAVVQVSAVTSGLPPNVWIPGLRTWWVPASPPQRADWRHSEILAMLERERRGAPVTVSVVPNYALFSVSNFRLYAVRDGLGMQFVRAWEDPPLGIDYMVLKSGDQGPAWTAEKSRRVIDRLATDPHLDRVFPVIGEFPLPDGSRATVRARRLAPVTGSTPAELAAALEAGFRRWLEAFVRDADGLEVRLVHDEAILNGRIRRVEVGAAAATVGELRRRGKPQLRVHDLGLVLEDVLVNPWSAAAEGRFDLLDVGRGRLATATVTIADLQAFVSAFKGFRRSTVTADGDALAITVRQAGPDVSARVRVRPASDGPLALEAEGVRVGGVPVPDALVSWVVRHFDPSARLARRARFAIEIGRVSVRDGALRISHELR
jgi:hypothetical protein